jgi:hypothetical protein
MAVVNIDHRELTPGIETGARSRKDKARRARDHEHAGNS